MPMPQAFRDRLLPRLETIAGHFGTPFHIYDEAGIRANIRALLAAFAGVSGFREYFAVKALPNPRILTLMGELGCGFDCSSPAELQLARGVGAAAADLMFTSTNTTAAELAAALAAGGCHINLDDVAHIHLLAGLLPEFGPPLALGFRYNPGPLRQGRPFEFIGNPAESKFGIAGAQLTSAYRLAQELGFSRFGLHTMHTANERDYRVKLESIRMLLVLAARLEKELGLRLEYLDFGGGLGIPYQPGETPLDIEALGRETAALQADFRERHGYAPDLVMESGRLVTGPYGALVTRVINKKTTYRTYVGVDASMPALMRPGMYGAYHHIEVPGKENGSPEIVDVTGSLCENNDKFAIQRSLPEIAVGDLLLIHDTGAHGQAMGFTYNGRLRPQELLLRADGGVERIRRAETLDDYLATLRFTPDQLQA